MKIVAVWNPKGGVGKSVLAVNLAAAACELGIKTLVIDEDQQGMALAYGKAGNVPFTVVGKSPKNRPDADLVVIDHQASDWNIPKAPLLLMPTKPARGDYRTYATARAMAEEAGKRIIDVLMDVQMQRANDKDVAKDMRRKGAFIVPSSGAFSRAMSDYRTIYDPSLNKVYGVRERRLEINRILGAVLMEEQEAVAHA